MAPDVPKRLLVLLHVLTGGLVALAAVLADAILGLTPSFGPTQLAVLVAGLLLIGAGFFPRPIWARMTGTLCLSLLSVLVLLAIGEAFFRAIAYDLANEEKAFRALPPFFRQPTEPIGQVFFKRPGPERWTGQVLNTYVSMLGLIPNSYENEPVITVEYNAQGFRNPQDLKSWDIAIAGDSFTELGYLPYEELFTTVLGRTLNIAVLNLGASYTGPLTQLSYLKDYGLSARTKHTVIMFFEGNDIGDLAGEYGNLVHWQQTGERESREFKKQSSLVRFLFARVMQLAQKIWPKHRERNVITGYFKSLEGKVPVTLVFTTPGRSDLSPETIQELRYFFSEYSAFGKKRGVSLWLAYVPAKERVLHDRLELSESTLTKIPKLKKLKNWQPTDLPQVIGEMCDQYGVQFIDLSPALIKETNRSGQLLYNALNDTHLNRQGSRIIGQELARHFKQVISSVASKESGH